MQVRLFEMHKCDWKSVSHDNLPKGSMHVDEIYARVASIYYFSDNF